MLNRAWLLDTSATLGALLLFLLAIAACLVAAGFVLIGAVRLLAELVRAATGRGKPNDQVAVPFGGPGDREPGGPAVDMPAGLEHLTPEAAAKAAERAQAIANMSAGGRPGPGPGTVVRPTGAVHHPGANGGTTK